jgi:hypothetical protein
MLVYCDKIIYSSAEDYKKQSELPVIPQPEKLKLIETKKFATDFYRIASGETKTYYQVFTKQQLKDRNTYFESLEGKTARQKIDQFAIIQTEMPFDKVIFEASFKIIGEYDADYKKFSSMHVNIDGQGVSYCVETEKLKVFTHSL